MTKKIPIDKDFLMNVLKKLEDLEKKVLELPQSKLPEPKTEEMKPMVETDQDYIFECAVFLFNISPANELQRKAEIEVFKKELEGLMRKYKVGRVMGTFIKSL